MGGIRDKLDQKFDQKNEAFIWASLAFGVEAVGRRVILTALKRLSMSRLIAIGDIHGCATALESLIDLIRPCSEDTLVALGDFVDRGIDSKQVLEQLIELEKRCRLVPILGNHDEMMLASAKSRSAFDFWMNCGGQATLDSYGEQAGVASIPASHFKFLERCRDIYVTDRYFFVHANYESHRSLEVQDPRFTRWISLCDNLPDPHISGRVAIVGHTPQLNGQILDLGYLKCLDTGCGHRGRLTAIEVRSDQVWNANE